MILRSIQVEGWRCFASSVHVGPFADGLNIIHGPNGIGKSSLMMALARGLFDNHNVGGADIKTLRSWGRKLAPRVTIEFEENEILFQLHKQFLDSASAKLSRQENGLYVPFAESRAADELARRILLGEVSGRGASDKRHWGLAQILWATQGSLKIDTLTSETQATVQDALGSQIVGSGTDGLEQKIAAKFGQFFTPSGSLKKGASAPAIAGLESQLEKANQMRAEHQQRMLEFETASRSIEHLQSQTQLARRNEQQLDDDVRKKREQMQAYQSGISQQQQYQLEVSTATTSYQILAERIKSIEGINQQLTANAIQKKQLNDELPALEKRLAQCQEEAKTADQKVKRIRSRRSEFTASRKLAQQADRYPRDQQDCLHLEEQLKKIDAAKAEIKRLRGLREPIVAPDKKTLSKIVKFARQRDDARLQLEASQITVSIQLDSDGKIEVTDGEKPGSRAIPKDEVCQVKGTPDVAFQIDGVGRFRAIGPASDFEALRRLWDSALENFNDLTAEFGTDDLSLLEALSAQSDDLDKQISQSEVRLNTLLDGKVVEQIRKERELANQSLTEIHREHPDWQQTPPDPAGMARIADEAEQKINGEMEIVESAYDQARDELQREMQKRDKQETEIANLQVQNATLDKRLKSFCNDGLEDRLRAEKLTEMALQCDTAEGKLTRVKKQVQELGDDPSKSLAKLEQQQKALRAQADEAEKKLNTESGRLEQIISEAPYSSLIAVEEQVVRLEEEIARQQLQIDAIRLLQETVTKQKSDVIDALIDPIRRRANTILRRISGSQFKGIRIDETLLPTGIAPQAHDENVSLDQISGGEQEQVHFAIRMALADIAFPTDRQLVVLDDVFTYTDADRLARIARILDKSADRFQIVLLTCHPERYRGLPNAKFFDLEKIARRREKKIESVPRSQAKLNFGVGSTRS